VIAKFYLKWAIAGNKILVFPSLPASQHLVDFYIAVDNPFRSFQVFWPDGLALW